MRKFLKKNILEIFQTMYEAHNDIKKLIEKKDLESVNVILGDCQNTAVQIGTAIEGSEGEGFVSVKYLEEYCEAVYQVATELSEFTGSRAQKALDKKLIKAENSVKNDIKVILEIVFLPYKASMWDSLESIWKAADADPDCNAHVIPIPYYDKNPDGTFGEMHYEGADFPEYVPLMHFEQYDLELMKPDVVYIHNPYDEYNNVTSVDPRFYSYELKNNTECLVYVPYYSTSGGMSDAQKNLSAYYYADHILVQSEKLTAFFDERIPKEKFLTFGSPKFDRVVNLCKDPPAPPAEWEPFINGKKVFFFNTSLGGMLANTRYFMRKMKYVFETFAKRDDVCLLWRPHPLFESTLRSMRTDYLDDYYRLRDFFINNKVGIYDTTPDITNTIALCDAYIGDTGSSVISLFGIAGKPLFLLNNTVTSAPVDEEWRGEYLKWFNGKYFIAPGNQLYYSPDSDFNYRYLCDLSRYSFGAYYTNMLTVNGRNYILPYNADDILIVDENGIAGSIGTGLHSEQGYGWVARGIAGRYIVMASLTFGTIICIDTEKNKVKLFNDHCDINTDYFNGERMIGGSAVVGNKIYLFSPVNDNVLIINPETGYQQVMSMGIKDYHGCIGAYADRDSIRLMPTEGGRLILWDPAEKTIKEYSSLPEEFRCYNEVYNYFSMQRPFSNFTHRGKYVYYSPMWGNMFIRINTETDEVSKWEPPFDMPEDYIYDSYFSGSRGYWLNQNFGKADTDLYFSCYEKKIYKVDFENNTAKEVPVSVDREALMAHEKGFGVDSSRIGYSCRETFINSLDRFLDDDIIGNSFDKNAQLDNFSSITNSIDGTSGIKTHEFIKSKVLG